MMIGYFLAAALATVLSGSGSDRPAVEAPDFSGPVNHLGLLSRPDVRAELKLDAKQEAAVAEHVSRANASIEKELQAARAEKPGHDFDGLGRMIQEADASTRKFAEEVLKPGQVVRLRQIQYHALGPSAFLNPELAEPLKLTPEQREAAREIVGESVDPARWFVPGDREATLARRRELRETGVKRIKDHLTPEQRERCEGLFGPPFELKMRLRQRPGPQA